MFNIVKDSHVNTSSANLKTAIPRTINTPPTIGSVAYNPATNTVYYANGTVWQPIGGSPDIDFITLTLSEAQAALSTATLIPGTTYQITGCIDTLYDDGTGSGTNIITKAISASNFDPRGVGLFWVPKYDVLVACHGVFNPATPSAIGSKTIWGGYGWTNTTGVLGSAVDDFTLDGNWTKNVFSDTDYVLVAHRVEYDCSADFLGGRHDDLNDNSITINLADTGVFFESFGNPIKYFQWGYNATGKTNGTSGGGSGGAGGPGRGIRSVHVSDSLFNNLNFCGNTMGDINLSHYSRISGNTWGPNSYLYTLILSDSEISGCQLENIQIYQCDLRSGYITNTTADGPDPTTLNFVSINVGGINFNHFSDLSYLFGIQIHNGGFANFNFPVGVGMNNAIFETSVSVDCGSSTVLCNNTEFTKWVYARPDFTKRVLYYDNADVTTIVAVTT